MTAVVLRKAWLTDVASGTALSFYTASRTDARATSGGVRRYAGGVLRSVTQVGRAQTLGVTAVGLSAADIATLDAWTTGRTLLFRDIKGRKLYGAAFGMDVKDYPARASDVAFVLTQITHSEAV